MKHPVTPIATAAWRYNVASLQTLKGLETWLDEMTGEEYIRLYGYHVIRRDFLVDEEKDGEWQVTSFYDLEDENTKDGMSLHLGGYDEVIDRTIQHIREAFDIK